MFTGRYGLNPYINFKIILILKTVLWFSWLVTGLAPQRSRIDII